MTDKEMIRLIGELAEDNGQTAGEYLLSLVKSANDAKMEKFKTYPEEVASQLTAAEREKQNRRKAMAEQEEKESLHSQIADFLQNFPGVSPEDVPEEVWNEVKEGVSLSHAFALWKVKSQNKAASEAEGEQAANELNAKNTTRSLPVETERAEILDFTREDVEKMSPSAVKSNYKKILNSMKKWKI
ncbi:MAG: hypothetical protein ACOX3X_09815 [Eubacteriales bacterium]|jgi:hypothetical protein